jgi:biotin-(acetyl-CoA carboxylase) ligase
LINNKKIGGIICEKIDNLIVVGIGINTNFKEKELGELSTTATTIQSAFNIEIDNEILLDKIIENINKLIYNKLTLSVFRENMAFLNEERFISQINKKAIIKGIDDNGLLIVKSGIEEHKIFGGII